MTSLMSNSKCRNSEESAGTQTISEVCEDQGDIRQDVESYTPAHPAGRPSEFQAGRSGVGSAGNPCDRRLAKVSRLIDACRKVGESFALDDFGAGCSSLTYFKQLPVATIKIDQTFVRNMLNDPSDQSLLRGVISLSDAFHREVIAERSGHGAMLLRLGCYLAQGYGIAHPMPAHKLPGWSVAWRPDPSRASIKD